VPSTCQASPVARTPPWHRPRGRPPCPAICVAGRRVHGSRCSAGGSIHRPLHRTPRVPPWRDAGPRRWISADIAALDARITAQTAPFAEGAVSRTPYGCSVGSWTTSAPLACSRAKNALMTDQSSGRAAKSFFVFLYHPIPDTGCFHLSCMLFRALLCVSSPFATISFRWLSCAFITSSALFPWNGASHGPPICLHVIVFIFIICF
jgi:hypothetical protein